MAHQLQKLRTWHEMLMDFMLVRPTATALEAAEYFDVHPNTINLVVNTDLFKARLAERRGAMARRIEDEVHDKLAGKVTRLAETSVDILNIRLDKERKLLEANGVATMELSGVQETAAMALKSLGFGASSPADSGAKQQTNVIFVDKDLLASSRQRMRQGEPGVIDVPAVAAS